MADDRQSLDSLLPVVYQELRRLAANYLRRERPGQTLQPTGLVHEAYLRLLKDRPDRWQNRAHFCAIAAHSMRQILIERARARVALKRGGVQARVTLDEALVAGGEQSFDILALDAALEKLAALDAEQARLVELRFFGGLTVEETAEAMSISPATVKRHWVIARAWLARELEGNTPRVNTDRWPAVNALFHAALDVDGAEREALLQSAAANDPELALEVRSLLARHQPSSAFLDAPAWAVAASLMADDEPSLVGTQVGSYQILEEIGRGGMGVVYAARDERLGRMVALKALPPEYTRDRKHRDRLAREARAAAAFTHEAIATVYALEEIDGELYIASELVPGETLRTELARGPVPPDRLVATLVDIASGLSAAHARNIIHRDLKPENLIRRTDGHIKILDFGLARVTDPDVRTITRLTEPGTAPGTPGYMAPEQLGGGTIDGRTDLFAFGIVAWELATGEHPFGSNPAVMLARMMEGRPATLSRQLPIPALDPIIRRCLRVSPDDRYASAEEILVDLRTLTTPSGTALATAPAVDAGAGLWWWQFHQGTMTVVDAMTPVLAWFARPAAGQSFRTQLFLAVLALATAAITLRMNLLFTSRVHPAMLETQRSRLFRWIAGAEAGIAALLLGSAAFVAETRPALAAILVSLAIVMLASLAVIEPATARGANRDR